MAIYLVFTNTESFLLCCYQLPVLGSFCGEIIITFCFTHIYKPGPFQPVFHRVPHAHLSVLSTSQEQVFEGMCGKTPKLICMTLKKNMPIIIRNKGYHQNFQLMVKIIQLTCTSIWKPSLNVPRKIKFRDVPTKN